MKSFPKNIGDRNFVQHFINNLGISLLIFTFKVKCECVYHHKKSLLLK